MKNQLANRITRTWLVTIIAFMLLVSLWSRSAALTEGMQWKGQIDSLPTTGLQGEWVVAGRAFMVDESTRLREDKGAFGVGVCVEVAFLGGTEPFKALKIATKSNDDCPDATPAPKQEAYGIVQRMPQSGLNGDWVIGGIAYRALPGAEFKQRNGPLVVGACAKVHYSGTETPLKARQIESRHASDCNGNGTIPPATPTPPPGNEIELYGRVDSFPEKLIGAWVVDGVTYTATDDTEFKQKNGSFAVDVCVKIHATANTTPAIIREIETERDYKCSGGGQDGIIGRGELYGEVQSFPEALIGEWNIAGITFLTDEATEFNQKHGGFAVGVTVKVHFVIRSNGDFYAREIETKSGERPRKGHAFGAIESIPEGRFGVWTIGGADYQVTEQTRLKEKHGALEAGARVRVKYIVDSSGQRTAQKIETTKSRGGATQPHHLRAFGFVNQMPAEGLVGAWIIGDVVYGAGPDSRFKESNGLLGVGAYVAVEYFVQDGRAIAHEIASKVPPGAGSRASFGVIDAKQETGAAAVSDDEVWRIGGVDYLITPATDIDDLESNLEVGNTALVNSYEADDGALVATQVRGVTINSVLYLPTVNR